MKKIMILLLVAIIITSCFTGCGGGDNTTIDAKALAYVNFDGADTRGRILLSADSHTIVALINEYA